MCVCVAVSDGVVSARGLGVRAVAGSLESGGMNGMDGHGRGPGIPSAGVAADKCRFRLRPQNADLLRRLPLGDVQVLEVPVVGREPRGTTRSLRGRGHRQDSLRKKANVGLLVHKQVLLEYSN